MTIVLFNMTFTLFSRILPSEIANIIFDYIKLQKTQQIYWEQLYSPASLIVKNLINIYSDYDKVSNPICYYIEPITIITRKTNKLVSHGLLQKNIYIYMDEYIDNLNTLKKHLEYHSKYNKQDILYYQYAIECLEKLLINQLVKVHPANDVYDNDSLLDY